MAADATTEVLVVGAGPTGLVLALVLARLGVRIRIIDRNRSVAPYSRALGVHARTLEYYRQLGFAEEVVEAGVISRTATLWSERRKVARVAFDNLGAGLTRYPFVLSYAQDEHERLLTEKLERVGVKVERNTALVRFDQDGGIRALIKREDGSEQQVNASYIAGCDGLHSAVRESLGVGFGGGTYERLFYVADVDARGAAIDDGVHVDLDEADLLAVFDMKGEGHVRLVGTIKPGREAAESRELTFADVAERPIGQLGLHIDRTNWFSTYRVHHRVAQRFSVGRAFLLGDAAHVHSPVGAQGMNTGIGDSMNLAWKLADVLRGRADAALLDTYATERMAFARRLVMTTDRVFEIATRGGRLARLIRTRLFPVAVAIGFRFGFLRRFLFRSVSQIEIKYRHSAISSGKAGAVHGGDRLPWVPSLAPNDDDNHAALESLQWQLHVYGTVRDDVAALARELAIDLHEFPWRADIGRAGLARDAIYLVRPDGYVAFADGSADAGKLRTFLGDLRPRQPAP